MKNQTALHHLSNGTAVILDPLNHVMTTSMGVWFNVGSRNEKESEFGISHVLEHMAFKGTKNRTYAEINQFIEDRGGIINAYTGFDVTAYHIKISNEHLKPGLELLADILKNSIFPADELEKEKNVILQELNMYEDIPESVIENELIENIFRGSPLGHTIIGYEKNIKSFTRENLIDYMNAHYTTENMVISLSGAGLDDPQGVLNMLNTLFSDYTIKKTEKFTPSKLKTTQTHKAKADQNMVYLKIAFPATNILNRVLDVHTALFLRIMGAGMSSRLFDEVREKQNLVYNISAGRFSFEDVGSGIISASTEPKNIDKTIRAIAAECRAIINDRPATDAELSRAQECLKSRLAMTMEESMNRAEIFGSHYLQFNDVYNISELVNIVDATTLNDIQSVANNILSNTPSIVTYGPGDDSKMKEWIELFK